MSKKVDVNKMIERNKNVNEKLYRSARAMSVKLRKEGRKGTGYRLIRPFDRAVTYRTEGKDKKAA